MKKLLIAIITLIGYSSCSNYYQTITASKPINSNSNNDFPDSTKYYILRNGSDAFAMKNISISNDRKNIQCTLAELPFEHQLHVNNGTNRKMKYKTKSYNNDDEVGVLNEVHIYINPGSATKIGAYTQALEGILKIEIIEKDKIKTKRSHVRGTIIGISTAVVGLAGVALLILSSTNTFF
jgi:hypothetical protein